MSLVKAGQYTFFVSRDLNKYAIKKLIEETFSVHVTNVKTINVKGRMKKTVSGRMKQIKSKKKAIITLKDKEKIDLFDTGKK